MMTGTNSNVLVKNFMATPNIRVSDEPIVIQNDLFLSRSNRYCMIKIAQNSTFNSNLRLPICEQRRTDEKQADQQENHADHIDFVNFDLQKSNNPI